MGYSHHINRKKTISTLKWAAFRTDITTIFDHYLYSPEIQKITNQPSILCDNQGVKPITQAGDLFINKGDTLSFNGSRVHGTACESFTLNRAFNPATESAVDTCKSRRQPYGLFIDMVTLLLEHHTNDSILIWSDGPKNDDLLILKLMKTWFPAYNF